MDVLAWLCVGLAVLAAYLWGGYTSAQREAFKWRKRWIIERFQAGVEGDGGNYFILSSYSNSVPCFIFAKRRNDLLSHRATIRAWNSFMGHDPLGENCDLPDEKAMGLPENSARDSRSWIAAGPGLCLLPPSIHERAGG